MAKGWNLSLTVVGTALLWLIAASGCTSFHHSHGHDGEGAAKLTLNDGKRWTTDEPLRLSMTKIRDGLEAQLPAIHAGSLGDAQYNQLAAAFNADVAYMVQNCKLDEQTDAMLHRVLADILAGTDAIQGKDQHLGRREGALKVASALNAYGNYFDHPGWRALSLH